MCQQHVAIVIPVCESSVHATYVYLTCVCGMLLAHTTAASNYNMGANRPYWHTRPVCFEKHVVKVCGFICGLDIFWKKTCFRGPLMVESWCGSALVNWYPKHPRQWRCTRFVCTYVAIRASVICQFHRPNLGQFEPVEPLAVAAEHSQGLPEIFTTQGVDLG